MSVAKIVTKTSFVLPPTIVRRADISRLAIELERIDNEKTAATVRAGISAQPVVEPIMSQQLTDFLTLNKLTIDDSHRRSELIAQLRTLKDTAPVIHMTFAVPADNEGLGQLVQWLRTSIHPQAVVEAGLQPALVAGVYLRTTNHIHDLSLRALLSGSHDVLVKELESLHGNK